MFRCHFCAACTPARTKAARVPIAARARIYPPRPEANLVTHDGKQKHHDDPGGAGYEIVREVLACPTCATRELRPLAELSVVQHTPTPREKRPAK